LKTRTILSWGGTAAFLLFLGGAAMAQGTPQDSPGVWMPFAASSYSDSVDFLYRVIFWVTTGMFLLTEGLLLAFCVIYRRRPGHRPTYTHGNNTAEITWTIIPALMLLGLAIWQIPAWNNIKKKFPTPADTDPVTEKPYQITTIDILGEQFKWNVRYPGSKEKFKAENELTNLSNVHLPFGNAAVFNLRSKDVIHSVFIPHMRVKQDTVPGLRQKLWFRPNRFFLKDLKAAQIQEGNYYGKENDEWVKKDRMVQPKVFIYQDGDKNAPKDAIAKGEAFWDKDFLQGGRLFDKRVAVENYAEVNGLYSVPIINKVAKKVKVLYQGKVSEGQEFASCDYALGIFEIACAELCGLGHYTMRAFLYVEPPAVFDAWYKSNTEDADKPPVVWNFWRN
jgi:cytochrome c oxidase subunit 2